MINETVLLQKKTKILLGISLFALKICLLKLIFVKFGSYHLYYLKLSHLNRLQILQKRAIRIVLGCHKYAHVEDFIDIKKMI